jgi:F-type H+-transporting ATPase subunit b
MDVLKQLGELLLTSIPTIMCLLIIWGAYRNLVQKKLQRVLGERRARTEGAIEEAQAQISKAEARTAEYEQRIREARSQIYKTQEGRRQHIMEKRSTALAEAHRVADEMVKRAHTDIERDVREAQGTLQQQAESLAAQIIDSILKPFAVSRE